ncbi:MULTISPECIES: hypothetical protein [unclassified Bradyrhizobium]|uniref:hypothetical protein n=1 Tax=unclassified Bradyrhizobium TaxID=2631580 RepID=UPI00209DCE5E|nr:MULTISPECIES: hypothetical protein [unclassified Bradyrhizobium]MCP1838767.1 hypothetical protein [Bradyrhizobium sp. USDA 4538]MCP1899333.1 hypothetical protein [Bradyrhizobium sp. USDA 4537]MCP1986555.1 hypothetical protein [Bradyrhizobium sp. USDA 4539]
MLAQVCGRAIAMARRFGAATIAVEGGLGKLRSTRPARDLNRTINYWATAARPTLPVSPWSRSLASIRP